MVKIKQYKDFLVDDNLNIYNAHTGHIIKPFKGSDGYIAVKLNMKNCKTCERVHVIYAHCFIPNPNNYKYVNHKDTNKLNNSLNNLEWCTNSYNVKHSYDNGNNTSRVKVRVETLNKEFVGEYNSLRECSKELKLDRHKISRILKGELRKDYLGYLFSYI